MAKRARGTRLIILVCRTSWSNCWLKKQIQTYHGYVKVSVYCLLQREDVALNSMNQLTNWVLEFHSQLFHSFNSCFRTEKTPKKAGGGGDAFWHYQYPVLRCDLVFGWNVFSAFQVFPILKPRSISMFYSQALKKENVNSIASIMDKKQQRTFERDTKWQDARTQSINAVFIGCLNTTIQTDRVYMSPHCCTTCMFAQGETHKRKSNQLAQTARN